MRLFCQLPLIMDAEAPALKPLFDMLQTNVERAKRSDTEIVIHSLKRGLGDLEHLNYPGFRFLNDREILRNILNARDGEYDGAVVLCVFDPAIRAARQMLDIPVTGLFEASVHLAAMMGRKFAVITAHPSYLPIIEENMEKYRMNVQAISHSPVRDIGLSADEFIGCFAGDYSLVLETFKDVARECIKDGAEVIIAGCGLLSTMLTHNDLLEVEGAPIIDPNLAGIKMAELMADIRKAGLPFISRKGLFHKAPDSETENVLKTCFFG
ncbi:MAG: hypothetical protein JRG75_02110 [Deltaproteobacteria bacterium]|nr:hypothetical protein [Deltaproteobacteria bacterium]